MKTRLWLASTAAVAIVAAGVVVAGPTLHGQAPAVPDSDVAPDGETIRRDIDRAVHEALENAFAQNGRFDVDLRKSIEYATRAAQDAVKDLDVEVFVDDAMQGAGVAMLGSRPRLGVSTRDVTEEEAKAAGLSGITGAYVTDVAADSAAAKAGIQAKDIIVSVDGENIRSARQLSRVIGESPDGRSVQVAYVRGTTRNTASVTPDRSPGVMTWAPGEFGFSTRGEGPPVRKFERRVRPGDPHGKEFDLLVPRRGQPFFYRQGPDGMRIWSGRGRLGVSVQPLTEQLATYFGVKEGLLVTQVNDGSAAAKAGIKAGDVITAVNGKPVKDSGDVIEALRDVENGKTAPVDITRDKKTQTITVTMEAPANTSGERAVTRRQRFTA